MNCCICGTVKNCAPYLNKVFENIEKIGAMFEDYKILIYYDKSSDNTLQQSSNSFLQIELSQKSEKHLIFIIIIKNKCFCF